MFVGNFFLWVDVNYNYFCLVFKLVKRSCLFLLGKFMRVVRCNISLVYLGSFEKEE